MSCVRVVMARMCRGSPRRLLRNKLFASRLRTYTTLVGTDTLKPPVHALGVSSCLSSLHPTRFQDE